jgi:hypothetical protein
MKLGVTEMKSKRNALLCFEKLGWMDGNSAECRRDAEEKGLSLMLSNSGLDPKIRKTRFIFGESEVYE